MNTRMETASLSAIEVPVERCYGAQIAQTALKESTSLRDAALKPGLLPGEGLDDEVIPERKTRPESM